MLGYIILGVFLLFLAVILIRAMLYKPKAQPAVSHEAVEFDREAAITALQKIVQCKTVSSNDPAQEDDAEFEKLISLLPSLYPRVFDVCSVDRLPGRALLFRWPGKSDGAPAVMMSHYDVVPVDEAGWEKPPFAGIIEDGILWGRGTLDTKATFNGVLSAANRQVQSEGLPEQTERHSLDTAVSAAERNYCEHYSTSAPPNTPEIQSFTTSLPPLPLFWRTLHRLSIQRCF